MWRLRPDVLRAALWALLSLRDARGQLRRGIARPVIRNCPKLPVDAGRGVQGVINRLDPTCLERSLVFQAWLTAHGVLRDVVIGIPPGGLSSGETAHAWVDGTDAASATRFLELHRWPPVSEGA